MYISVHHIEYGWTEYALYCIVHAIVESVGMPWARAREGLLAGFAQKKWSVTGPIMSGRGGDRTAGGYLSPCLDPAAGAAGL